MKPDFGVLGPVMTVREVAEYHRIYPSTMYRLLREGNLPAFRIGSDWSFSKTQVDPVDAAINIQGEGPQGILKRIF